jgi:uncharacterized protein (TIGR00297 family)
VRAALGARSSLVLPLPDALLGIVATAALAAAAVYAEALTSWAGAIAAVFGAIIVVVGGFPYLCLLVLFVVASVLATRYGLEEKTRRQVQEGTRGERGVDNVLAHILIPTALVLASLAANGAPGPAGLSILYASAIAFGASDTFASEFGVLQAEAVSILTFRAVPAGQNGGVSRLGTLWAAVGALVMAVLGVVLFRAFAVPVGPPGTWIAIVAIAGFLGCQVDSVIGELLENRGLLSKGDTNFIAMLLTVLLAAAMLAVVGSPVW